MGKNIYDFIKSSFGYDICDVNIFKAALTHPSLLKNKELELVSYERLEFLGDSVLNLAIAEILYKYDINFTQGDLSIIHSNLVNGMIIANVAKKLDLGSYMIMDLGEEQLGGRDNPSNLEDVMEALLGALYLDSGDYKLIFGIIKALWIDYLSDINSLKIRDSKSTLQEWAQKKGKPIPFYAVENIDGASHAPIFEVSVEIDGLPKVYASGKNKKQAEQRAAKLLLEDIKSLEV